MSVLESADEVVPFLRVAKHYDAIGILAVPESVNTLRRVRHLDTVLTVSTPRALFHQTTCGRSITGVSSLAIDHRINQLPDETTGLIRVPRLRAEMVERQRITIDARFLLDIEASC
ncbi:hypothetical protein Ssi03_09270 [Sphaerisporangium siamense]|nr:hypothetical protein Ssi03_09270 [Sphaerisporangium siamense]